MMQHASPRRAGRSTQSGFTLIEILVVVAIIALLISILMPSLRAARNQDKVMHCQANLKQISTTVSTYQAEANGCVPIIFNDAAIFSGISAPARTCWVSVALRNYSGQTRRLGQRNINGVTYDFDPEKEWSTATRDAYETYVMPELYACPFQRGKGPQIRRVQTSGSYRLYTKEGRFDSIQTWLSENVVSGQLPPHGVPWIPSSPGSRDGLPKYTAFSWNCVLTSGTFKDGTPIPPMPNAQSFGTPASKVAYRKWTTGDARRLRSGSLSTSSVAYCAQGENILGDQGKYIGWANPGSHPKGGIGGTNVIFADSHVEWGPGKQVGWP